MKAKYFYAILRGFIEKWVTHCGRQVLIAFSITTKKTIILV